MMKRITLLLTIFSTVNSSLCIVLTAGDYTIDAIYLTGLRFLILDD